MGAVLWLYVIDLIEGNVNEEDKKKMRDALLKITKGSTRLSDLNKVINLGQKESAEPTTRTVN